MERYGADYGRSGWGANEHPAYDEDHGDGADGPAGGMSRKRRYGAGGFSAGAMGHGTSEGYPNRSGWSEGCGNRDQYDGFGYGASGFIPGHLPASRRERGTPRGHGVRGSNLPGGNIRGGADFGFSGGWSGHEGDVHGHRYDSNYGGRGDYRHRDLSERWDELGDRVREGWHDVRRSAREMFRR